MAQTLLTTLRKLNHLVAILVGIGLFGINARVFVLPVEQSYNIRTGEQDASYVGYVSQADGRVDLDRFHEPFWERCRAIFSRICFLAAEVSRGPGRAICRLELEKTETSCWARSARY